MEAGIQYFNSQEAANILNVNVSTIKRWTDEGKLECVKTAGGHRKFLMEHLVKFLENNKKQTERINLFPLENETDLRLNSNILKGNFTYLTDFVKEQALACNRERVQQVMNGLYMAQYPLYQIYDHLVTPVMHEIGELWLQKKISISEEHIATQAIKDCIIRLQGIIRIPRKKSGKAFCLNFAGELHSMALKMVEHIMELRGFKVIFSGQRTPLIQLEKIFEIFKPERVYISGTMVEDGAALQKEFDEICGMCASYESRLFVGGRAFDSLKIDHPAVVRRLMTFEDVQKF